jgi:hypothetical protein
VIRRSTSSWPVTTSKNRKRHGWAGVAAALAPLAAAVVTFGMPLLWTLRSQKETYPAALVKFGRFLWPSVLTVLLASAGCAAAAYRRQRRFGLPHAAAWACFVFMGGLPGWIAYRFHRQWPVLEECPTCHQPAPPANPASTGTFHLHRKRH